MLCSIAPNIYHDQCIFVTFRSPSSPYITHNPYVYKMHLQFLVSAELSMWLLKTFSHKNSSHSTQNIQEGDQTLLSRGGERQLVIKHIFLKQTLETTCGHASPYPGWPLQCGVQCKHDHQQFPASGSWWLMGAPGTVEQGGGGNIMPACWHSVVRRGRNQ